MKNSPFGPRWNVPPTSDGFPNEPTDRANCSCGEPSKSPLAGEPAANRFVVGSYTNFLPKTKGGTDYQPAGEVPFRDVVTLVKSNGTWLVDSQAPAEGLPPTAVPTASATSTPTSGASQ